MSIRLFYCVRSVDSVSRTLNCCCFEGRLVPCFPLHSPKGARATLPCGVLYDWYLGFVVEARRFVRRASLAPQELLSRAGKSVFCCSESRLCGLKAGVLLLVQYLN